jgi:hypothetical protein
VFCNVECWCRFHYLLGFKRLLGALETRIEDLLFCEDLIDLELLFVFSGSASTHHLLQQRTRR